MPLSNGRLGVAIWSADGLTAQSNRADTMPARLSTGQVVIPGIVALSRAKDYAEQAGVVADAMQEDLVQDIDGLIRVTSAIPP
jgi:hypothetical protein